MNFSETFKNVTVKNTTGLVIAAIVVVAAAPKLIHWVIAILGTVSDALGGK
jgi:hypothetical protein